jgi:hypothetical protein
MAATSMREVALRHAELVSPNRERSEISKEKAWNIHDCRLVPDCDRMSFLGSDGETGG